MSTLHATTGRPVTTTLSGVPTGIADTLTVTVTGPLPATATVATLTDADGITEPATGTYTLTFDAPAVVAESVYAITWTASPTIGTIPPDILTVSPAAVPRPTLEDVGTLIVARTKENRDGGSGDRVGTFTEWTTPTDDIVDRMIDQAARDVASESGPLPDGYADLPGLASDAAAALAAALVEASYDPERSSGADSAYQRMWDLYRARMGRLTKRLTDLGVDIPGPDPGLLASHSFPPPLSTQGHGLIAWGTVYRR